MLTFLDLLIVMSMALIAVSLLSLALMFLVKNETVRKVCFYIAVALSLYIGYVGIRINRLDFFGQAILAAVLSLVSVGSLVLALVKKNNDKLFLLARVATAAAVVLGIINALLI